MADEDQNRDYKAEWMRERERLAKLWAAFESQERELRSLKDRIEGAERTIADKDRLIVSLKDLVEARDRSNRNYELELIPLRNARAEVAPKIEALTRELQIEKERFAKLFGLAEDLDEELRRRQREIEVRDEWFRTNVGVLRRMDAAIQERERMLSELRHREYRPAYKATLERLGRDEEGPAPELSRTP